MTLLDLLTRIKDITQKVDILQQDVVVGFTVTANGKLVVKHSLSHMRWFDDPNKAIEYIEARLKEFENEIVSEK